MYTQLSRVLIFVALLSLSFTSYSSKASSVDAELQDIQETVKNFISSFSVKDAVESMSPSTIIGLCITLVIFAIVFRSLIFFMIMFGVLIMILGSTEKATDYLKEKFTFSKGTSLQPDSKKKDKDH
ncbi:hypothetical protein [Wolbachia endosymbiont of Dirofilaria (Dirofilaria) immitis]|uniref:hypothetical protein n=1 Tax=Wolbachia endosymbiont of Dirofilaria (Dirofilaria) immitis TaxID=1812115 RepID=UPI00158D090F|nr:hypothetical protein [Wolbachia endosymbiont of Dirofilaria (Dirofilaria) immitis]QKX02520.1 hypothetical protein GOY12_03120 [Wolbachia endosymbiont of Dirofilaria (Dirofilaria) immitis]